MNQNDIAWRDISEAPVAVGLYELRLTSQHGELLVVPGEFDGIDWGWNDLGNGPFLPHSWRAILMDSPCWDQL